MFTFNHVTYQYQNQGNPFEFDFQLKSTGLTALVGENGAGKSTLIRLMAGLARPTNGDIFFNQELIQFEKLPTNYYQKVGVVLQNADYMLFNPTVFDELAYGPRQRYPEADVQLQVQSTAQQFNLEALLNENPTNLSGGQKKILSIACVAINNPQVILIDEPFSGVSSANQKILLAVLHNLKNNCKIIISHHNLRLIQTLVDSVLLIKQHHNESLITDRNIINHLRN